jgi:hypothetical protein
MVKGDNGLEYLKWMLDRENTWIAFSLLLFPSRSDGESTSITSILSRMIVVIIIVITVPSNYYCKTEKIP